MEAPKQPSSEPDKERRKRRSSEAAADDGPRVPVQNLGLIFIAAAVALAFVLGIVATIGYFAFSGVDPAAAPPRPGPGAAVAPERTATLEPEVLGRT